MSIHCKNLSLKNGKEAILENITLDLPDRQITALYGPTGSGKTVLLLIFAGLMKPASGKVKIDGLEVNRKSREARRQIGLGVIPEFSPLISKLTLEENLRIQARMLHVKSVKRRVQELLQYLRLEQEAHTLTDDLPAFSRAKASLGLALLNDPQTLMLDEPEYRLTSEETEKMWSYLGDLKEKGKCIVVSTRYQEVAAKCDAIFNIPLGKVVSSDETDTVDWTRTETAFA